jgi:hypothetical protein
MKTRVSLALPSPRSLRNVETPLKAGAYVADGQMQPRMPKVYGMGEHPHLPVFTVLQQPGPNIAPQLGQPAGDDGQLPVLDPVGGGGGASHVLPFFV